MGGYVVGYTINSIKCTDEFLLGVGMSILKGSGTTGGEREREKTTTYFCVYFY